MLDRSGEQTCADGIVSRSGRVRSVAASDAAVTTPRPASKAINPGSNTLVAVILERMNFEISLAL